MYVTIFLILKKSLQNKKKYEISKLNAEYKKTNDNNILELIKYGDSINEIIDKINSYIYSKIEDKDKIDRLKK